MAGVFRRQITRLAWVLACSACSNTSAVSGKVPERTPREPAHEAAPSKHGRADGISEPETTVARTGPTVEKVDPAEARIGAASTHVFHRVGCASLKGVPTEQQVRFTSQWEAVDAGYSPCESCRPMR